MTRSSILALLCCTILAQAQEGGSIVSWGNWVLPPRLDSLQTIVAVHKRSLGLRNGAPVAWGENRYDSCDLPTDLGPFTQIAAGYHHQLGLRTDGSIAAWGYNYDGACEVPEPNTDFIAVAAGSSYSLGLKSDGTVVGWGWNAYGQCDAPNPNQNFVAISANVVWSMGLKADGHIVVWGYNAHGVCDVPEPNEDFVAVVAGGGVPGVYEGEAFGAFGLGLKSDGSVVTWGWPALLPEPNANITAIAGGGFHSLGLRSDGSIITWGNETEVPEPNTGFVACAAGLYHSLGLKEDGTLVGWGSGTYGQAGLPVSNQDFTSVSANLYHNLGRKTDGSLIGWGSNTNGECTPPNPDESYAYALAGCRFSLAITESGNTVAWGNNATGQLDIPWPTTGFVSLDTWDHTVYGPSGDSYTWNFVCGIKEDASIVTWGSYASEMNPPAPNTDFVSVKCEGQNCIALKADGSIRVWGMNNDSGQLTVPEPNEGFIKVAAGDSFFLGLKADGSIVPWGSQTLSDIPQPNADFIEIAAAPARCVALRSDGTVAQWGLGSFTMPVSNENFIAVDCEYNRTVAIQRTPGTTAVQPPGTATQPTNLRLLSRYPNPFNPTVTIEYELADAQPLRLIVYNLAGETVLRRELGPQSAGIHSVRWNGQSQEGLNVASGMYLLQIEGRKHMNVTEKCLLLR